MITDFTEGKGHLLVLYALAHNGAVVGGRACFPADWRGLWDPWGRVSICSCPWRGLHSGTQQSQGHSWMKQHSARRQEACPRVLFPPQPQTGEAPFADGLRALFVSAATCCIPDAAQRQSGHLSLTIKALRTTFSLLHPCTHAAP